MNTQTYTDWSLKFHQQISTRRIPLSGSIELTRRCNLACVHCYNNLPLDHRETRRNELSYEAHCRILDEITAAGCLFLLYTGGEIFARSDFPDIYTYAKQKGLLITLFTNATLITPATADYLASQRPFSIEISLYGRTRETHERITGIPGSHERVLRGIRLLAERGLPLTIKTMALTLNQHELRDMQQLVEIELGLKFKFDAMINPRIDYAQDPLAVRLRPEEIVALDLQYPERISEWKQFCEHFHGSAHDPKRKEALFDCGAGVQAFAVDPFGRLSACLTWPGETYDLRRGSFQEGWEIFLETLLEQKATRQTKCRTCGLKNMCGMCPVNARLECRDPETPVDFLCRTAHLRAYAMNIPVTAHGACEYCEGGSQYGAMMETAAALRADQD